MNAQWLRAAPFAAAALLTTLLVTPSQAQVFPGASNRPGQGVRRPAPKNYLPELKTIAEEAATRLEIKLVVDPGLFVAAKPTAPDKSLDVNKTMDALAQLARDLSWRRVYLSQAQGNVIPPADKLVDTVRALDKVEQAGVVLENPATRRASTYLKDWSVGPNFKDDLASGQFNARPVYVLYALRSTAGRPAMDELADMQRRSMELMMSMDPDQMAQAMDQGLQMFMNMDPDTRGRFLGMQMQAGMKMFQNMSPDQRNQLMQSVMQSMQQSGGFPFGGGAPGGRP